MQAKVRRRLNKFSSKNEEGVTGCKCGKGEGHCGIKD